MDRPGKKLYVLLIMHGVVRAVHLELTGSLNLEDFVLAFRHFCTGHENPSIIFSDNARTFKNGTAQMKTLLPMFTPAWRFIVPAS